MRILLKGDNHFDAVHTPKCRIDDFLNTQIRKINAVNEIAKKHNAIVIDAGDISDVAVGNSPSDAITRAQFFLDHIKPYFGIFGNHDLRHKLLSGLDKSIVSVLVKQNICEHLNYPESGPFVIDGKIALCGFNFSQDISHLKEDHPKNTFNIAVYHGFVSEKKDKHVSGLIAKDILKEFHEDYDLIVTADHHKPFVVEYEGSTLINTGPLMRRTIKEYNYKPFVWIFDTETREYIKEYLPIEPPETCISLDHKEEEERKEEALTSFIIYMNEEFDITQSFNDNMVNYLSANSVYTNAAGEKITISPRCREFINGCTSKETYTYGTS